MRSAIFFSVVQIDREGEPCLLTSWLDITALKLAQRELQALNATLEQRVAERTAQVREQTALLDLAHDAIIVRGLDGTIRYWNRGAERLYSWDRDEAVGRVSHELLQTRFVRPPGEPFEEVLREGYWEGELQQSTRTGESRIVASRWVLQRSDDGTPADVLEINTDITSRRRAEEEQERLRVAAEEERAALAHLEERERIAMDLHDGAIQSLYAVALTLGAQELAVGTSAPGRTPEEQLATLRWCRNQLSATISSMRAYIAGLRSARTEAPDLAAALAILAGELRMSALPPPVLELDPGAGARLSAEAVPSLVQIAREAVSNAYRHGGAQQVTIRLYQEQCSIILAVSDDGRGFDPAAAPTGGPRLGQGLRNMAARPSVRRRPADRKQPRSRYTGAGDHSPCRGWRVGSACHTAVHWARGRSPGWSECRGKCCAW